MKHSVCAQKPGHTCDSKRKVKRHPSSTSSHTTRNEASSARLPILGETDERITEKPVLMAFYLCDAKSIFVLVKSDIRNYSNRCILWLRVFLCLFGRKNRVTEVRKKF